MKNGWKTVQTSQNLFISTNRSCQLMVWYGVYRGRTTGVFSNWEDCRAQTHGYKNAWFKKFTSMKDATEFAKTGVVINKQPRIDSFFPKRV